MVSDQDAYAYYLDVMEAHQQLWQDDRPLAHTEMLLFKISIIEVAQDFVSGMLERLGRPLELAAVRQSA